MGIFSGIDKATTNKRSNYLRPGKYIVRIDKTEVGQTRKGDGFAVFNETVLVVIDNKNGTGHNAGESVSDFYKQNDSFLGNIKTILASVFECESGDITEDFCNEVFGSGQPLSGWCIEIEAFNVPTKDTKNLPPEQQKHFTVTNYLHRVRLSDLEDIMDPKIRATLYPGDTWAQALQREAAVFQ